MPENIFKSEDIEDEGTELTVQKLGREEQFAKDILKSLKEKISDARNRLNDLEDEIEEKTREAENRKDEILQEAQNEADRIRQEAEDEARQIVQSRQDEVEAAREEGYQDGYEDGQQEARKDMADLVEQAQDVLEEAKKKREAYIDQNTKTLIELAGELAHNIVRDHVELERTIIEDVVRSALDEISDVQEITVVLSPEDAEVVRDVKNEFVDRHPNLREITISQDSNMERGGCRIRTNYGDIQATLRGQVEHLTEQLVDQTRTSDGNETTSETAG